MSAVEEVSWQHRPEGKLWIATYKEENRDRLRAESKAYYNRRYKAVLAEKYAARKEEIDAYKLAAGCVDCGYKDHAEALDFDHVLGTKKFGIAKGLRKSYSMETIWSEIAKCEVRCANCHRVATRTRRLGP